MKKTPFFARTLASGTLLIGIAGASFAQTNFTFMTGYDPSPANANRTGILPTLSANGSSPTDEVNYNNFVNGVGGVSQTSAIYGNTNGEDIEADSTVGAGPYRIAQGGFFVPAGQAVTLTSVTFDVYDLNATSNPFTNAAGALTGQGFFQIFSGPPQSGGAVYAGNFTTNLLTTTPTFVGYRIPNGVSSTDTSRPMYQVTLDLTKIPNAKPLTSAVGPYYFGISMNKDAAAANDINFPLANATDPNTGQPGSSTGANQGTNGDGVVYNMRDGYRTDTPIVGNNNIYAGFAMTINGTIASAATPEPNSLLFALGALPLAATGFAMRCRRALRG